MRQKALKCLWGITSTILLALYLFFLYGLLLTPAILDWSSYGVMLTIALAVLLIWCVPSGSRIPLTALSIVFLMAMRALDSIRDYPAGDYILAAVSIFIVLLLTGKVLGHFTIRRYLVIFLVALLLNNTIDLSQVPFLTEFKVRWESPQLYPKLAGVDYFPIRLADLDGDGRQEIIVQENREAALAEQSRIAEKGKKDTVLEPETNRFTVFKWNAGGFLELTPGSYDQARLKAVLPVDYPGFPFYETSFKSYNSQVVEEMQPQWDKAGLVDQVARFASFPFILLAADQENLESILRSQAGLKLPAATQIMAAGKLLPGPGRQIVSIDGDLKVREDKGGQKLLATLDRAQVPDIGTSEISLGDVDGDGVSEILLTAETARILKLVKDGRWVTLWANGPNPRARFQGFRFEDFASLGSNKTPNIIALSKSNMRDNPARYMTGYVYKDGALIQKWRVFAGLINLRAGDVDGDGRNELVGYMYRGQRVFVLEKHNFPVVQFLYIITGLLILTGFTLQWRNKKLKSGGGSSNA